MQKFFQTGSQQRQTLREISQSPNRTSLMIVRHPFERLVSAFRDKLEIGSRSDSRLRAFAPTIVALFREKAVAEFGIDNFNAENNYGSRLPVRPHER